MDQQSIGEDDVSKPVNLPKLFEPDTPEEDFRHIHKSVCFEVGDRGFVGCKLMSLKEVLQAMLVPEADARHTAKRLLVGCATAFAALCGNTDKDLKDLSSKERACCDLFSCQKKWNSMAHSTWTKMDGPNPVDGKGTKRGTEEMAAGESNAQQKKRQPAAKRVRTARPPLMETGELWHNDNGDFKAAFESKKTPDEKSTVLEMCKKSLCERLVETVFLQEELEQSANWQDSEVEVDWKGLANERARKLHEEGKLLQDVSGRLALPTVSEIVMRHTSTGCFTRACNGFTEGTDDASDAPWNVQAWDNQEWTAVFEAVKKTLDGFKTTPAPPPVAAAQQQPGPNPDQEESAPDDGSDNDSNSDRVDDNASDSVDGKGENGSQESNGEEMEDKEQPDTQMPGVVLEQVSTMEEDNETTQGDDMLADLGTAETQPSTQPQNVQSHL